MGAAWGTSSRFSETLNEKKPGIFQGSVRVSEGTRTPDRLDHNQELYQLSYAHRGASECSNDGTGCPRAAPYSRSGVTGPTSR